jgi:hypothetical protein
MDEYSIAIMLVLGTATGVTVYLVNSHRVDLSHAILVWSAVVVIIVGVFFEKFLRYKSLHYDDTGIVRSVITEYILPTGLPSLGAILVGAVVGWGLSERNK